MSAHWRRQAPPEVACLHGWPRSALVSLLAAAGTRPLRRVNSAARCSGRGTATPDPPPVRARCGACGCDEGAFVFRWWRRADARRRCAWAGHGQRGSRRTAMGPLGRCASRVFAPAPSLRCGPAGAPRPWARSRRLSSPPAPPSGAGCG